MEDIINEQKAHPWYMSIEYFDSKVAWSPQTGRLDNPPASYTATFNHTNFRPMFDVLLHPSWNH